MIRAFLLLASVWSGVLSSMALAEPLIGADPLSSDLFSAPLGTESTGETGSPAELRCGTEAYWDATLGHCQRYESPPVVDPNLLPPPPGVVILRPDGVREQADTCPEGFRETAGLNGWRFCVDVNNPPQPMPPLEAPPIAGVPYEEALKILERHREALMKLPGVESVGLDAEGIRVEAHTPPPGLPAAVEGLPVRAVPPSGGPLIGASHTLNTRVRPLHGGAAISDNLTPANGGTLTAVGLFQGKPWLIFPSHLLGNCAVGGSPTQTCPVGTSLTTCSNHYGGTTTVRQPIGTVPETVGRALRWDVLQTGVNTTDAALAFMDNDTVEGNGSLSADRMLEIWGSFSGDEATPVVSTTATVTVVSIDPTNSGTHIKPARVTAVGQTRNVGFGCRGTGSPPVPLISQMDLQGTGTVCFSPGDSGSPILDGAGRIIGTFNWIDNASATCTGGGRVRGGGTSASAVRQILGFERWYGTQTVNDNTIGVFRSGTWYVDNGNGRFEGPCTGAAPYGTLDQCFGYGWSTDSPVTGDWDNAAAIPTNDVTVGVYRPVREPTAFYLSDTNPPGTVVTMNVGPSSFGYKPVTGKWRGNNGASNATSKVGVFRPSTGGWYLDSGNLIADGCGTVYDYCFFLAAGMYQAGDTPIAGDWNGNGVVSIGLFRPGGQTGTDYFYLSTVDPYTVGNNGTISLWSYAIPGGPGSYGYLPVVGDWTGTGGGKVGVLLPSAGWWYLDNGNFSFLSCAEDQCPSVFGTGGDKPVAFGKSLVKAN